MTYRDKLAEIGWSQAELLRRVGLDKNAPYRWREVPVYVDAYLDLALGVKRLGGSAAELLRRGK